MSADRMPISRGIAPLADIPDREGGDGGPELVIRGEHPVIAMPVLPRRGHEVSDSEATTFLLMGPRGTGTSKWLTAAFPGAVTIDRRHPVAVCHTPYFRRHTISAPVNRPSLSMSVA